MWLEILIFAVLGIWLALSIWWVVKHRKTGGCCGDCSRCARYGSACSGEQKEKKQ